MSLVVVSCSTEQMEGDSGMDETQWLKEDGFGVGFLRLPMNDPHLTSLPTGTQRDAYQPTSSYFDPSGTK